MHLVLWVESTLTVHLPLCIFLTFPHLLYEPSSKSRAALKAITLKISSSAYLWGIVKQQRQVNNREFSFTRNIDVARGFISTASLDAFVFEF